ncbi:hypothetical protein GCM10025867_50620 (plasmid) [Frondihabitans sucicola]|uniref:Uncharacterized protein n=1 Tax=Frondihabitans sucicola TaxID=1268041 RepID=A0ABM8GWH5_9MICO|nr:hypothetical protein [Frondihabitans sucicola]BDZ52821.1 hypothetical protein GCM10025867_50620 [Frondihabitans sucicola]
MTKNARRKKSVRKRAADAGTTFSAAQDNSHLDGGLVFLTVPRDAAPSEPLPIDPSSPLFVDYLGLLRETRDVEATPFEQPAEMSVLIAEARARIAARGPHPWCTRTSPSTRRASKPSPGASARSSSRPRRARSDARPTCSLRGIVSTPWQSGTPPTERLSRPPCATRRLHPQPRTAPGARGSGMGEPDEDVRFGAARNARYFPLQT